MRGPNFVAKIQSMQRFERASPLQGLIEEREREREEKVMLDSTPKSNHNVAMPFLWFELHCHSTNNATTEQM